MTDVNKNNKIAFQSKTDKAHVCV